MRWPALVVLLALTLPAPAPAPVWKGDIVKTWARTLGDDLWRLSESLTELDQIKIKYKQMNASVKKKDGKHILEASLRSVSTMLTRKINAVKCIHATAQNLAREYNYTSILDPDYMENFEYCSAKYSNFSYEEGVQKPKGLDRIPKFAENNTHYLDISLEKDSHFYDISVNTNISCVHVPTNIYYKETDVLNSILWSEGLNKVFINNYQSDPSLSWQYFGSSHGILRFYPGMPWNTKEGYVDTYDCRVKSWYIEAATCSKDVIVLFDVSGSMTGFKNYVARITLESLLSTLSNNDYINVYTFGNITEPVVKCFEMGELVQATPENLETLMFALRPKEDGKSPVPLEGNANLTAAYIKAFRTLEKRRNSQSCNVTSTQGCNQMVMLITDYVPGNLTEVFEEYNRIYEGDQTYIPVRVFTFLIGKEVTNVGEIQSMACTNRGYFVHIHSVEEVQQQVLKYINVIARPMILAGEEPPPTWTHANLDTTRTKYWGVSGDIDKPDEDKLVASVAIPAFDFKYNEERGDDAILLGVAGTDVPIDSIAKLAQPHQLGVNGYSFIVSNNGYLLLHPLLIATINGDLQVNYNSVDFVEVEQVDDGKGSRELGDKIKRLREYLVDGIDGNMTHVEVLFHYDKIRRISRVKHDYFFNKLEGTPFSMGISLPRGYGDTELLLRDNPLEAKQGKDLTGINVTDYFRFSYRVHPDWVYCKFHYLEGHETENAEMEIWSFLVNLSMNKTDITKKQYSEDIDKVEFDVDKHCFDTTRQLDKDDYYCNEDLVKQLVFDAKLTAPYFEEWHATPEEWKLAKKYNVTVRFIATSSGLTRWHYIFEKDKNEKVDETGNRHKDYPGSVFGDRYHNAIEESWYKAAVLQHMIDKESLVISSPLPILDNNTENSPSVVNEDGDITLTASYAIFYKDGETETPVSVVGFEFPYSQFYKRFNELISGDKDLECGDSHECYVIDSSGYVLLSAPYNLNLVGQAFGAVNRNTKLVFENMINKRVFDHVEVFNYQALCPTDILENTGGAWTLETPFNFVKNLLRWVVTEMMLFVINWNQYAYAQEELDNNAYEHENDTVEATEPKKSGTFSCDKSIILYILNQKYFLENMGLPRILHEDEAGECFPPFWATLVPKTNLLLVVVERENRYWSDKCPVPRRTIETTDESKHSREPCHKLDLGGLHRRRLEGCFTYHDQERNITECGLGNTIRVDITLFLSTALIASLASTLLL